MSGEVQQLAGRYGAAWAEHDLDAIMAMHTDDAVFHLHGTGEPAVGLVRRKDTYLRLAGTTAAACCGRRVCDCGLSHG